MLFLRCPRDDRDTYVRQEVECPWHENLEDIHCEVCRRKTRIAGHISDVSSDNNSEAGDKVKRRRKTKSRDRGEEKASVKSIPEDDEEEDGFQEAVQWNGFNETIDLTKK